MDVDLREFLTGRAYVHEGTDREQGIHCERGNVIRLFTQVETGDLLLSKGAVRWMRSRRVCQRPMEGTFQCNCRTYFPMNAANMANTQIQHLHLM